MEKILEYIFGNMQETDMVIRSINKTLRHQNRFNGRLCLLATVTAGAVIMLESRVKKLEAKIEKNEAAKGE